MRAHRLIRTLSRPLLAACISWKRSCTLCLWFSIAPSIVSFQIIALTLLAAFMTTQTPIYPSIYLHNHRLVGSYCQCFYLLIIVSITLGFDRRICYCYSQAHCTHNRLKSLCPCCNNSFNIISISYCGTVVVMRTSQCYSFEEALSLTSLFRKTTVRQTSTFRGLLELGSLKVGAACFSR
jgi:hypothetical protein